MKNAKKTNEKKQKIKKKTIEKPKKEKVLVVAQEIKFARLLSGNEKKNRDRVLKTLKKWLQSSFQKKYEFKEDDFIRVWKGLFYAVWMSDKPLVQEELCESIAEILDLFPQEKTKDAMLMTKAGFRVLATEWYGIDQHRMDKFLMLVRRYLRGSFRCLLRSEWSEESCQLFVDMISGKDGILSTSTPYYARNSTSMVLHVIDCYLEELSKVSDGKIPESSLCTLLHPFLVLICSTNQLAPAARKLLAALMRQSDCGLKYGEATRAWKSMGCPEGGPEALQRVSDDEDEEDDDDEEIPGNRPLDPRAGRVHVWLRPLGAPAAALAATLRGLVHTAPPPAQRRARLYLQRLEQLSEGDYPFKQVVPPPESPPPRANARRRAASLVTLEKRLVSNSDELALRGLSRKHRKRLLAKSRAGSSIVEEVATLRATLADSTNGEWQVESTEPADKESDKQTSKQDTSNKENVQTNKKNRKRRHDTLTEKAEQVKIDKKSKKAKKNKSNDVKETKPVKEASKEKERSSKKPQETDKIIKKKLRDRDNKSIEKKETKKPEKIENKKPTIVVSKAKNFQKQTKDKASPKKAALDTPKKVKFVLKNNCMQGTIDYYKSVRQSPSIPFDSKKKPEKTNLKPSAPSPINPFFKKKLKMKK